VSHVKDIHRTEFYALFASITLVRIDMHKVDLKAFVSFAHNLYLLLEIGNLKLENLEKIPAWVSKPKYQVSSFRFLLELVPFVINQLGQDTIELFGMDKSKFTITKRSGNLAL